MSGLVEFLRARLDEDEEVARAAVPPPCKGAPIPSVTVTAESFPQWTSAGRFATRHNAARVLAEVEAKRRIVEWHENWPVLVETEPKIEARDGDVTSAVFTMSKQVAWLTEREYVKRFGLEPPTGPVLALLAMPYADHPDYREEWRP